MPPKSLMELAIMACIQNIKFCSSVGDLPFETVKHVLMRVDNAQQLRQFEKNSPQIQGETGEIWQKLIERDFTMEYKANPRKPRDPAKWYKVWEVYKHERDQSLQANEKQLLIDLDNLKKDKEKNTSKIVGGREVPGSLRAAGEPKRFRGQVRDTVASSGYGRSKLNTGANVMRRVRRETQKLATMHGSLPKPVRANTQLVGVKKAPEAMINEHKRASQPAYRPFPKEPAKSSFVEKDQQRASSLSDSQDSKDEKDALPTARSDNKPVIKPPVQSSKPGVACSGKPKLTPFQMKFAPNKSLKYPPPYYTKPTSVPSNGAQTSAKKAQENRTAAQPSGNAVQTSASQDLVLQPHRQAVRSKSPEGAPSPQYAEELVDQFNEAADEVEPKQQPARKRKAVDIFMRPKRRF